MSGVSKKTAKAGAAAVTGRSSLSKESSSHSLSSQGMFEKFQDMLEVKVDQSELIGRMDTADAKEMIAQQKRDLIKDKFSSSLMDLERHASESSMSGGVQLTAVMRSQSSVGALKPTGANASLYNEGPVDVGLALMIRRIGEVDTAAQTFKANLMIILEWNIDEANDKLAKKTRSEDDGDDDYYDVVRHVLWKPKLSFPTLLETHDEGSGSQWKLIPAKQSPTGLRMVEWKFVLHGTFAEPLELQNFPFDCQDLTVTIWTEFTTAEAVLVPSIRRGDSVLMIVKDFMTLDNWQFHAPIVEFMYTEPSRSVAAIQYSNVFFRMKVERNWRYFFDHVLVYCTMFCILTLCAFAIDPIDSVHDRLGYILTLVLTMVAFQFIVADQLPDVQYMTHLDNYIRAVFFFMFFMCGQTCFVGWYLNDIKGVNKRYNRIDALDQWSLYGCIFVVVFAHIGFGVYIMRVKKAELHKLKMRGDELKGLNASDTGVLKLHKEHHNVYVNLVKNHVPWAKKEQSGAFTEAREIIRHGICKVDHFESIYKLTPKFLGAPNLRQASGFGVFGSGQPTLAALKKLMAAFRKLGFRRCVWINMRSEPVIYVNGNPYAPADPCALTSNVRFSQALSRSHVELLQLEYLHAVMQSIADDGEFSFHRQTYAILPADRKDIVKREPVTDWSNVLTVSDLYLAKVNTPVFPVIFKRLLIADERAIKPQQLDTLATTILQYTDQRTAVAFNCQMGKGRTSVGMICTCLLKKRMGEMDTSQMPELHLDAASTATIRSKRRAPTRRSLHSTSSSETGGDVVTSKSFSPSLDALPQTAALSALKTPTMATLKSLGGDPFASASAASSLWPTGIPLHSMEESKDYKDYMQRIRANSSTAGGLLQMSSAMLQLDDGAPTAGKSPLSETERRAGDYSIIRNLLATLTTTFGLNGAEIKLEVDDVIDRNQHMQNMRVCIALVYDYYSHETEDRREYWLQSARFFMERYAVLILFNAYLHECFTANGSNLKDTYSNWIQAKSELSDCIGTVESGPLSHFLWD